MGDMLVRRLRVWSIQVVAIVVLGACASSAPIRPSDLDTVIRDAERKAQLVNQFQADFVKTRRLWLFDKKLKARGKLIAQKPGRFWMALHGDINVDVLSDGKHLKVIHDRSDEEVYPILGDRDLTQFTDPLMLLIGSIENGGFRKLSVEKTVAQGNLLILKIRPGYESGFERTKEIFLTLTNSGDIRKVTIVYWNGDVDETRFTSWALLDSEGPEISMLNERLSTVGQSSKTETIGRAQIDEEGALLDRAPSIVSQADSSPAGTIGPRQVP